MIDPVIRAQMERTGAPQVRLMVGSGNWPSHLILQATEWLHEKAQEEERLNEAANAAQAALARDANEAASRAARAAERQATAAESANARATIALIIAIISIIATAISIWISHVDAVKPQ
jgi:cysteinyl-tRNA synthetase